MTKQYKISRISEDGAWAREVNPYGEESPERVYLENESDLQEYCRYEDYAVELSEWENAESKLKEYPLSEESAKKLIMDYNCAAINDSVQPKLIGQAITGTLNEKGEIEI